MSDVAGTDTRTKASTIPDAAVTAVVNAIDGIRDSGPDALMMHVGIRLRKTGVELTEDDLVAAIVEAGANDRMHRALHIAIGRWDDVESAGWANGTEAGSDERRSLIMDLLEVSPENREHLDAVYPTPARRNVMIDNRGEWDVWYTEKRRSEHTFYWKAYEGLLEKKGWHPDAIAKLGNSTTETVSRLADPAAAESYQSKGLVVGHVQSGKTANFTGLIAKAIDAGYRLVIVLTGTYEILRSQTQRRLDMELVGEENILGGRDRNDPDAMRNVDYVLEDEDWAAGRFLRHDFDFVGQRDVPGIVRLTTLGGDYKALRAGLDTLDFRRRGELVDPQKPVFDPVNLYSTDVRLAVVKKNVSALKKLITDLKNVHASLAEIPVLIIDDEADQASVNTVNPDSAAARDETKTRTAINRLIHQMLSQMKRAQYVGYTATPFANVFVSPEDAADIFPSDFIYSLEPGPGYMGGRAFHDLMPLTPEEKRDPAVSNEAAHVRDLRSAGDEGERAELLKALDAFVITGAIKKWREANDPDLHFRHHTMLVHESVKQDDHADAAKTIRAVWDDAAYTSPTSLGRLREHYEDDFVRVTVARDWGTKLPDDFDELIEHIGATIDAVMAVGNPVVVVNGSNDSEYRAADFQSGPYWRIMVGGAKLSRGFTVEDLTVSYYRRRTNAADTLMQMGRWFGFRRGYGDLVRLYIDREVIDRRGNSYDLYDAFTSIIEDEEDFREELRRFARYDKDGHPTVRPIDVPPMVFQQLPWLTPTARNKMFNAELKVRGIGGRLQDFARQADRGDGSINERHFDLVEPWLDELGDRMAFEYREKNTQRVRSFFGRVAIVPAQEMYDVLARFQWAAGYSFRPTLAFMRDAMGAETLRDWAVLVPELDVSERSIRGHSIRLMTRTRRDRGGFSGSSFRQRSTIERIAGSPDRRAGERASKLDSRTRGAMLLSFAADPARKAGQKVSADALTDPIDVRDIATIFSLAFPYDSARRGRIGFTVRDESREDEVVIDAGE